MHSGIKFEMKKVRVNLADYKDFHSVDECTGKFVFEIEEGNIFPVGDLGCVHIAVPYVSCKTCGTRLVAPEFREWIERCVALFLVLSRSPLNKDQLRFLRIYFGLTQESLAKKVGFTDRQHYQKYETRANEMTLPEEKQKALKIFYAELLGITEAKPIYKINRHLKVRAMDISRLPLASANEVRERFVS